MTFIDIKNRWDIALNGKGYMLRGTPESPRWRMNQGTQYNQRYAQGDRTYLDFYKNWYMRQTDWYQGVKDDTSWEDDGKYYVSTNISTHDEQGMIKLELGHVYVNSFTETLTCGSDGLVSADSGKFIGTYQASGDSKPKIYKESGGSFTDISPSSFPTNAIAISSMYLRDNQLWVGTSGNYQMAYYVVFYTVDGATFYDCSTNVATAAGAQEGSVSLLTKCLCQADYAGDHYIFVTYQQNSEVRWCCLKTGMRAPISSEHWTNLFSGITMEPVACIEYSGDIFYILYNNANNYAELWKWSISTSTRQLIQSFRSCTFNKDYGGDKYLHNYQGKLIITVPYTEIWQYDGQFMSRIWKRDETKRLLGNEYSQIDGLYYGGVVTNNKIYWHNLVYNGTSFYNWVKDAYDSADYFWRPLFVSNLDQWYGTTSYLDGQYLYRMGTSSYKGTDGNNWLIFNNFDNITGVSKNAESVELLFDTFDVGEGIKVQYTTEELTSTTSWNELGSASYTGDGTGITNKKLYFPDNTDFRKIWFRIQLFGDGTSTPKLKDFVLSYLPKPEADAVWTITINSADYVKNLANENDVRTGREIKENLWLDYRKGDVVDYQDINYCSTTLSGNLATTDTTITVADTSEFPEQGRLMIGDVIYYYTGKTQTTFTGVTQGEKNTTAIAQTSGTTVHNGYKVRIQSIDTVCPNDYTIDTRELNYDIQLSLREVI